MLYLYGLRKWFGILVQFPVGEEFFSVLRIAHTAHILLRVSTWGDLWTETVTVYSNAVQKLRISVSVSPFPNTHLN